MINEIVNNGFPAKSPTPATGSATSGASASEVKPAAPAPEKTIAPSSEQLDAAVSKLNDYVQNVQRTLSFSVDKDTGVTVVKVIDTQTNELVRQIPAENVLKLAADLDKQTANLFVKERA
jgi:flagellar protein FlaG